MNTRRSEWEKRGEKRERERERKVEKEIMLRSKGERKWREGQGESTHVCT